MRLLFLFLLTLLISIGCHKKTNSTVNQAADSTLFARPEQLGDLADGILSESSGIAASKQNPGYLWTEEDSGNPAEIQLISQKGEVAGRYTLAGVDNRDWEDIAVGPGPIPGKSYVYVADIGDNRLRYPVKIIYRFPEPTVNKHKLPATETIRNFDRIRLQLPDGPKNAEAILVDPGTLDLYVLSKDDNCVLYKASYPQSLTRTTMMQRLSSIPAGYVTSAAISSDGQEILIRSYHELGYFHRQAGESILDALKKKPRLLPLAEEPQGEAIGWATDGSGYYTTSERTFFFAQPLYFYRRN